MSPATSSRRSAACTCVSDKPNSQRSIDAVSPLGLELAHKLDGHRDVILRSQIEHRVIVTVATHPVCGSEAARSFR